MSDVCYSLLSLLWMVYLFANGVFASDMACRCMYVNVVTELGASACLFLLENM